MLTLLLLDNLALADKGGAVWDVVWFGLYLWENGEVVDDEAGEPVLSPHVHGFIRESGVVLRPERGDVNELGETVLSCAVAETGVFCDVLGLLTGGSSGNLFPVKIAAAGAIRSLRRGDFGGTAGGASTSGDFGLTNASGL